MTERQDHRPKARLRFAPPAPPTHYRGRRLPGASRPRPHSIPEARPGCPHHGRIRLVDREDTWASLEPSAPEVAI